MLRQDLPKRGLNHGLGGVICYFSFLCILFFTYVFCIILYLTQAVTFAFKFFNFSLPPKDNFNYTNYEMLSSICHLGVQLVKKTYIENISKNLSSLDEQALTQTSFCKILYVNLMIHFSAMRTFLHSEFVGVRGLS